jgi:hypothetical protein
VIRARRRCRSALLGVALTAGVLGLAGEVAGASAPIVRAATGGDPPACETMPLTTSGALVPDATVSLGLECPAVQAERLYSASITTGGVAVAAAYPYEAGRIAFPEVVLPPDWPVQEFHTIALYDAATGETVGISELYVDEVGRVAVLPEGVPQEPPPDLAERVQDTGLVTSSGEAAVKAAAVLLVGAAYALRGPGARTARRVRERRRGAGWARELSSRP